MSRCCTEQLARSGAGDLEGFRFAITPRTSARVALVPYYTVNLVTFQPIRVVANEMISWRRGPTRTDHVSRGAQSHGPLLRRDGIAVGALPPRP
jgi:hypothetical protein